MDRTRLGRRTPSIRFKKTWLARRLFGLGAFFLGGVKGTPPISGSILRHPHPKHCNSSVQGLKGLVSLQAQWGKCNLTSGLFSRPCKEQKNLNYLPEPLLVFFLIFDGRRDPLPSACNKCCLACFTGIPSHPKEKHAAHDSNFAMGLNVPVLMSSIKSKSSRNTRCRKMMFASQTNKEMPPNMLWRNTLDSHLP